MFSIALPASIPLQAEETFEKVTVLSANQAVFIREPESFLFQRKALSFSDCSGHPHIPFSGVFACAGFLNPRNWWDRSERLDAYDILLTEVATLNAAGQRQMLDRVLLRHVTLTEPQWEHRTHFADYQNIKEFLVDRKDTDNTKAWLWFAAQPFPLALFSRDTADSLSVYIGHVHVYRRDTASQKWNDFGGHGRLFQVKYRERELSYDASVCDAERHQ
jgi:hypothetical protein